MTIRRAVPLLLCTLTLAACGGDDEGDSGGGSGAEPTATETGGGGGGEATESASVTMEDFTFTPGTVTVTAGGTVEWTDKDSANHNVIFDGDDPKDIGNLREGESGTITFPEPGSFAYVCSYHPGMEGTVEVQ